MAGGKRKPPENGDRDERDTLDHAAIFHMTVRHGAEYTKRYLDSLAASGIDDAPEHDA